MAFNFITSLLGIQDEIISDEAKKCLDFKINKIGGTPVNNQMEYLNMTNWTGADEICML